MFKYGGARNHHLGAKALVITTRTHLHSIKESPPWRITFPNIAQCIIRAKKVLTREEVYCYPTLPDWNKAKVPVENQVRCFVQQHA